MLELEQVDGIEILRLAHGKANALDMELLTSLDQALERIEGSDARAVMLTARGSIFSAGLDLFRVLDGGAEYLEEFMPVMRDTFTRLFFFPKPVVAAVNGHAIAGGCVLLCACDYRLALTGPWKIGVPELLVGVPFPAIALETLRQVLPLQHFQEIVYTGATYRVEEALSRGLVDEVVGEQEFFDRALHLTEQFGSLPAEGFRLTKEQFRGPARAFLEAHGREIDRQVAQQWTRPETLEVIRRYLDQTLEK